MVENSSCAWCIHRFVCKYAGNINIAPVCTEYKAEEEICSDDKDKDDGKDKDSPDRYGIKK